MTDRSSQNGSSAAAAGDDVPEIVAALSLELLERSEELATAMADHLHRQIPELGGDDAEMLRETRASCRSNIIQSNRLLHGGGAAEDLIVTPEAREYVRGFVNRGMKVPVLLRTYRLGHAWIWELWSEELRERAAGPKELSNAIEYSSRWMFEYIDLVSAALVEDFATEQARRVRSADQLRAATVREIFEGGAIDREAASRRLGYELDRAHLALHVWSEQTDAAGLERAAQEAIAALGGGSPLVVACGAAALDIWCACDDGDDVAARARLSAYVPPADILVAAGGGAAAAGIEGFRAARDEAREAARVRSLAGQRLGPVTIYGDVELVSLLSGDLPRARRFVRGRLGELASDDPAVARVRETLLAYLACNRSSGQAAKRLFVHQNTVTYRVHRAEELLGRPLGEDSAELLCALILAGVIGAEG